MILNNPLERQRFIRFSIVGISGTIIDFVIFNLLLHFLKINPITSKALSFSIAVFNNFLWNRLWTYPESRNYPFLKLITQFVIVSIIGLMINTLIFYLTDEPLIHIAERITKGLVISSTTLGHNLSAVIATVIVLFWNYFANRYWTFKNVQ